MKLVEDKLTELNQNTNKMDESGGDSGSTKINGSRSNDDELDQTLTSPPPGHFVPEQEDPGVHNNATSNLGSGGESTKEGSSNSKRGGHYRLHIKRPPFFSFMTQGALPYPDTIIICSDGSRRVHRLILFNISPFLGSLFNDQMPGETVTLVLPDVPLRIMCRLLDLAYTGTVKIPREDSSEMDDVMNMLRFIRLDALEVTECLETSKIVNGDECHEKAFSFSSNPNQSQSPNTLTTSEKNRNFNAKKDQDQLDTRKSSKPGPLSHKNKNKIINDRAWDSRSKNEQEHISCKSSTSTTLNLPPIKSTSDKAQNDTANNADPRPGPRSRKKNRNKRETVTSRPPPKTDVEIVEIGTSDDEIIISDDEVTFVLETRRTNTDKVTPITEDATKNSEGVEAVPYNPGNDGVDLKENTSPHVPTTGKLESIPEQEQVLESTAEPEAKSQTTNTDIGQDQVTQSDIADLLDDINKPIPLLENTDSVDTSAKEPQNESTPESSEINLNGHSPVDLTVPAPPSEINQNSPSRNPNPSPSPSPSKSVLITISTKIFEESSESELPSTPTKGSVPDPEPSESEVSCPLNTPKKVGRGRKSLAAGTASASKRLADEPGILGEDKPNLRKRRRILGSPTPTEQMSPGKIPCLESVGDSSFPAPAGTGRPRRESAAYNNPKPTATPSSPSTNTTTSTEAADHSSMDIALAPPNESGAGPVTNDNVIPGTEETKKRRGRPSKALQF